MERANVAPPSMQYAEVAELASFQGTRGRTDVPDGSDGSATCVEQGAVARASIRVVTSAQHQAQFTGDRECDEKVVDRHRARSLFLDPFLSPLVNASRTVTVATRATGPVLASA